MPVLFPVWCASTSANFAEPCAYFERREEALRLDPKPRQCLAVRVNGKVHLCTIDPIVLNVTSDDLVRQQALRKLSQDEKRVLGLASEADSHEI